MVSLKVLSIRKNNANSFHKKTASMSSDMSIESIQNEKIEESIDYFKEFYNEKVREEKRRKSFVLFKLFKKKPKIKDYRPKKKSKWLLCCIPKCCCPCYWINKAKKGITKTKNRIKRWLRW